MGVWRVITGRWGGIYHFAFFLMLVSWCVWFCRIWHCEKTGEGLTWRFPSAFHLRWEVINSFRQLLSGWQKLLMGRAENMVLNANIKSNPHVV
jgi:hypothetical protein